MHGYTDQAVLNYYFGRTATALGRDGVIAPTPPTTETRVGGLGLTDRERDVAELAVSGFSYAQIARDLFVAQSTVGYHLSNIYAKCGVSSRHELTALVRSAEMSAGRR